MKMIIFLNKIVWIEMIYKFLSHFLAETTTEATTTEPTSSTDTGIYHLRLMIIIADI